MHLADLVIFAHLRPILGSLQVLNLNDTGKAEFHRRRVCAVLALKQTVEHYPLISTSR